MGGTPPLVDAPLTDGGAPPYRSKEGGEPAAAVELNIAAAGGVLGLYGDVIPLEATDDGDVADELVVVPADGAVAEAATLLATSGENGGADVLGYVEPAAPDVVDLAN
jgi:hypothetical protein